MAQALRAGPVSSARFEAHRILTRVDEERAFADIALQHAVERARLDARDAALCAEIVYGTLRWQRYLDWRLAPHLRRSIGRLDAWVRAVLRLTAYQAFFLDRVPHWAAVDEAVSLARLRARTPGPAEFVNAVLRALLRNPRPPDAPSDPVEAAAIAWSFPDWVAARWARRLGLETAARLMAAMNERPPTTVRTNSLRATRDDLLRRLRDEELLAARPTALSPEGVLVDRSPVSGLAAFAEGWCVPQDEASMLVARLLDPRPGELVVDACAAPGTKATHLAQLMDNRGAVIAMDPQAARLKLVAVAATRLGATIVETHLGTAGTLAPRWRGRADRALVDAPCSNLGVLRRNPEVKWRRTEDDLRSLAGRQSEILASAASTVKPGGVLVYATCSLEPEENDEVVAAFLAAHPEWERDQVREFPVAPGPEGFVRCWPHVHGTDGFTAIRLRHGAAARTPLRAAREPMVSTVDRGGSIETTAAAAPPRPELRGKGSNTEETG
jgi:16S rRNA (cytosine967-C5)-methyltransferase